MYHQVWRNWCAISRSMASPSPWQPAPPAPPSSWRRAGTRSFSLDSTTLFWAMTLKWRTANLNPTPSWSAPADSTLRLLQPRYVLRITHLPQFLVEWIHFAALCLESTAIWMVVEVTPCRFVGGSSKWEDVSSANLEDNVIAHCALSGRHPWTAGYRQGKSPVCLDVSLVRYRAVFNACDWCGERDVTAPEWMLSRE